MARICLLVLDSLGVGGAPDAAAYGDEGADTLGHIAGVRAAAGRPLDMPHLTRLGLGLAAREATGCIPAGLVPAGATSGLYGCATEQSFGKDTPSGHFELAGVPVTRDWGYFTRPENSVPQTLLDELAARSGVPGFLGNCKASGTDILVRLGEEHLTSGKPIIYTSTDSVLQIAAHEQSFGLDRLLALCRTARALVDALRIGRVIARPFTGEGRESFVRTGNRHDYAMPAPGLTVLDRLCASGGNVIGVGKIGDIFAHRGVSTSLRGHGHDQLMDLTLEALQQAGDRTLVMTNLVDFDMIYGHRRDVEGYARALERFDRRLPALLAALAPDDLCIVTADHGCDPTWRGTDHTRERVPVLAFGARTGTGCIGVRKTMADVGATIAEYLGLPASGCGRSFLHLEHAEREDILSCQKITAPAVRT